MAQHPAHCPACGQAALITIKNDRQVTAADGTMLPYHDESSRCQNCGEELYSLDQSLAASRLRAGALRAFEGLLTPEEVIAIRAKLGLSQAQLEKALGLGAKTVVRWERGTVCQSRAADSLLIVARDHPTVFASLAARFGVTVTPKTVAVPPRVQHVVALTEAVMEADQAGRKRWKRRVYRMRRPEQCEPPVSMVGDFMLEGQPA
jgi:putative zinc finger/helix-turn-helix YgiT family protein